MNNTIWKMIFFFFIHHINIIMRCLYISFICIYLASPCLLRRFGIWISSAASRCLLRRRLYICTALGFAYLIGPSRCVYYHRIKIIPLYGLYRDAHIVMSRYVPLWDLYFKMRISSHWEGYMLYYERLKMSASSPPQDSRHFIIWIFGGCLGICALPFGLHDPPIALCLRFEKGLWPMFILPKPPISFLFYSGPPVDWEV